MYLFSKLKVAVAKPVTAMLQKPTPITYIGPGKASEIPAILQMNHTKKVFLIASNTVSKSGLLDSLLSELSAKGISCAVYTGVKPDPTFDIVAQAQEACGGTDMIVAIGGGSVLDTAKTVAAAITNGGDARKLAGLLRVKHRPIPLILVPTTAGTGSETTLAAVISDSKTHLKKQIIDPKIVPICAILDPELTIGLPVRTTATTTMDALTHALEAYVSDYATAETDRFSEIAVKLIFENLPLVMKEPENLKARENLLAASFYAGMAFTRVYVGYVHAFSHAIGGKFGVSHGLANAVLLPHIMEYYRPVCEARFAKLELLVGGDQSSCDYGILAKRFIAHLFEMNSQFEIPQRLVAFPCDAIDDVIQIAFKEAHGTYPVPRYLNQRDARLLLSSICSKADNGLR